LIISLVIGHFGDNFSSQSLDQCRNLIFPTNRLAGSRSHI